MQHRVASLVFCLLAACGGSAARERDLTKPEAFERAVAEQCGLSFVAVDPDVARALAESRVTYQADVARRCLAVLEERGCRHAGEAGTFGYPVLMLPGICRRAYVGTLPADDECQDDAECAGDAHCGTISDALARTCKARTPPGSACFSPDSCAVADEQTPDCSPDSSGVRLCTAVE